MTHLYLFDEAHSNASLYGIGVYIRLLTESLKNTNMHITIVKMFYKCNNVVIENRDNIRYIYIPDLENKIINKSYYYRSAFFILYPFISIGDNNIFHYNYLSSYQLSVLIKSYFPKSLSLLTIHYRELTSSSIFVEELIFISELCQKIIVLTKASASFFLRYYNVPLCKIEIIPNYIPIYKEKYLNDKSDLKDFYGISKNKKVILYVGRFDYNKNPYILLQSFLELLKLRDDVHLILIGNGDFNSLFSLIDKAYGNITFTGFLEQNELHKFYSIADLGVIPSRYEEFGYVALEMMMHGIPLIANKIGGLAEIIEDGVTGDLIDLYKGNNFFNSINLLVESMNSLLSDEEKRKKYSFNAYKCYFDNYNKELYCDRMLNLYKMISSILGT